MPAPMDSEVMNNNNNNNNNNRANQPTHRKRSSGAFHMLKVTLFMLRYRSNKKTKTTVPVEIASKSPWKRLVNSVRLLKYEDHEPKWITEGKTSAPPSPTHDNVLPPSTLLQIAPDSPISSKVSDIMSQYASAQNLQELDVSDEHSSEFEGVEPDEDGDVMIDARAEEFIASFYEKMRLEGYHSKIQSD